VTLVIVGLQTCLHTMTKSNNVSSGRRSANKKKRSPLFDRPQNRYEPTDTSSMTRDELSAWRKDQRKKRNRESAARSRIVHRQKVQELEQEVAEYRIRYEQMEERMSQMQERIDTLTRSLSGRAFASSIESKPSSSVRVTVSPPPSPSCPPLPSIASPDHDAGVFPPLLSDPPTLVETQNNPDPPGEEKHIMISRQA